MGTVKNHSERKHALLSASGAHRWINCPPSAKLEEQWKKEHGDESSVYADEGTLAHEVCEAKLRFKFGELSVKQYQDRIVELMQKPLYQEEMKEHAEVYVEEVVRLFEETKSRTPDAKIFFEKKVDFSSLVPGGFGTADALIIGDDSINVIDFKYGKGVEVSAKDNPQMMLYAIGLSQEFELMFDANTIKMTIVQPRINHIDSYSISKDELFKWAGDVVAPAVMLASKGLGEQKAGDHCKFCRIKPVCKAMAVEAAKTSEFAKKPITELTPEELAEVYSRIPQLEDWINSLTEYMTNEAVNGRKFPGFKLVEGRSIRKWTDESLVEKRLAEKFEESDYMVKKLAGIPAIEKLVGKKEFDVDYSDLVCKPAGKPTLVPDSDKRPEISPESSAIKDFQ